MSTLVVVGRRGRPLLRLTWARLLTALALFLPMGGGVLALHLAAPEAPLWPAFLLALAVGWAIALPDGMGGLVVVLGFGAWWVEAVADPLTPWALLGALSLLSFHTALAQAAVGPWGLPVETALLGRLVRDLLAVATVTAGVAWLATSARGWFEAPLPLVAVTLALAALLPWVGFLRRPPRPPQDHA